MWSQPKGCPIPDFAEVTAFLGQGRLRSIDTPENVDLIGLGTLARRHVGCAVGRRGHR